MKFASFCQKYKENKPGTLKQTPPPEGGYLNNKTLEKEVHGSVKDAGLANDTWRHITLFLSVSSDPTYLAPPSAKAGIYLPPSWAPIL